ncbi:MAG TPA: hypothetical protein VF458_06180 [Ktedonobacteraceae bacterium]
MNKQEKTRVQERVQALYRYASAMEQGQSEVVSAVLAEAQQDATLERMVLELNEVYQIEDRSVAHPDDIAQAHEMLLDVFAGSAGALSGATTSQAASATNGVLAASLDTAETGAEMLARRTGPASSQATPIALARRPRTLARSQMLQWRRSRAAALVAVALLAILIVPVLSAFAPQFLALFRPQQFTSIDSSTFRDPNAVIKNLDAFLQKVGDNTTQNYTGKQLSGPTLDKATAEKQVHFHIQLPANLSDGAGSIAQFTLTPADQESFTFNATKTRAYLQATGQAGIAIPPQLDGATFKAILNPGVIVSYYQQCSQANGKLDCSGGTPFLVTEIPDPTLQAESSTALSELRAFLLSLPKLPADTRALLQHVDINSGAVPVPLPRGASSTQVNVKGAPALLITLSDNGGIIWQSQNIVYVILTAHASGQRIQEIANSLR